MWFNPGVPTTTATSTHTLERRLGPLDAAAIIVSNVIGAGILFSPPQIAASVPSALLFLSTWLAGGLLAFAGAMAYAELAALRPRAGGEYVYLKEAYGPLAAFLTGWTAVTHVRYCAAPVTRRAHTKPSPVFHLLDRLVRSGAGP